MEFRIPQQDSIQTDLSPFFDCYSLRNHSIFKQTKRNATIQFSFNDSKQAVTQVVDRIASYSLHRSKIDTAKSQYSMDYKSLEFHRKLSNSKRQHHA